MACRLSSSLDILRHTCYKQQQTLSNLIKNQVLRTNWTRYPGYRLHRYAFLLIRVISAHSRLHVRNTDSDNFTDFGKTTSMARTVLSSLSRYQHFTIEGLDLHLRMVSQNHRAFEICSTLPVLRNVRVQARSTPSKHEPNSRTYVASPASSESWYHPDIRPNIAPEIIFPF